jgi:hypothetical protein
MYSLLRLFLLLRMLGGKGWEWRLKLTFALAIFCVLIYSVVR